MKKLFILLFVSTICFGMHTYSPPEWNSDDEIGDPRSLSSSVELELSAGEQQEFQELFDALKKGKDADTKTTNKQNTNTQSTRAVTTLRAQHESANRVQPAARDVTHIESAELVWLADYFYIPSGTTGLYSSTLKVPHVEGVVPVESEELAQEPMPAALCYEEDKSADIKTTNKQNTNKQNTNTQSTRVVTALRAQHELENRK